MRSGFKCAGGTFRHKIWNVACLDLSGVEIGAVERRKDGDSQYFHVRSACPFAGRAYDIRVAVHSQKVEVELRQPPHRRFDRGTDVEQLEVHENSFAVLVLQLVRQRHAAAGQHAQPDLVETDRGTQLFGHRMACNRIWHIEGNDQAVIGLGHGRWINAPHRCRQGTAYMAYSARIVLDQRNT